MITEGQVVLEHQNKYKKTLTPFEQDSFMGDWKTISYGKATDFNLMLNEGLNGGLEPCFLGEGEQIDIALGKDNGKKITNVFYALNGCPEFTINDEIFNIEEKDLLCVTGLPAEREAMLKLANRSKDRLVVIRAEILE